jgi:transposase-like protein
MVAVRVSQEKHAELEGFWRHHHDEWVRGTLNQREYCELHGLPLKRFGNWRAQFKGEENVRKAGLLHRRGGLSHMTSHMTDREVGGLSVGYIPSARALPEARRAFGPADKRRILTEAGRAGASISAVAKRYGIAPRVLFRWKQELAAPEAPVFLPVTVADAAPEPQAAPMPTPVIVERSAHGIEVDLIGGRRVRFAPDTDPATVRAMVELLEGADA